MGYFYFIDNDRSRNQIITLIIANIRTDLK